MNAVLLWLATFASTAIGGMFALRFRDHLHLVPDFTAGVLLGVVCFDLLPEIFELARRHGSDGRSVMAALVAGFLFFHGLEKFLLVHRVHEAAYAEHQHPDVGMLSATALIGLNTMSLMLIHRNTTARSLAMLGLDALV